MGCQSSRKDNSNSNSPTKKTTSPPVSIRYHKSFAFNATGQTKGRIILEQVGDTVPVHLALEQVKENAPSNYLKGHFEISQKVEMPINLPQGRYRLHVVMNWEKQEGKYTVKFDGNAPINFKQSEANDKHQNFYDCITEECKKKGKTLKSEKIQVIQSLYHEPWSNLIIVTSFNPGEQLIYYMPLDNCKEQHLYKIINPKVNGDQQWIRKTTIPKKSSHTWIIAPKVQYTERNIYDWEIKDAILGGDECAMMQFGAGFSRPVNPPPDAL